MLSLRSLERNRTTRQKLLDLERQRRKQQKYSYSGKSRRDLVTPPLSPPPVAACINSRGRETRSEATSKIRKRPQSLPRSSRSGNVRRGDGGRQLGATTAASNAVILEPPPLGWEADADALDLNGPSSPDTFLTRVMQQEGPVANRYSSGSNSPEPESYKKRRRRSTLERLKGILSK